MTKDELLNNLFDSHTQDLNDVYSGQGDVFVCPVCMRIFPREAINEKALTDGHVWPKYFRSKSQKARNMRVLLCSHCNHTAGSHGDKHMQIDEQIKDGEAKGEWYGSRKVQLFNQPGNRVVNLNVNIIGDAKKFTVSGRVDKNKRWIDGSPHDQAGFQEIINKSESVSILIHPPKGLDHQKVPQGWITSAYLMAFYSLGYRYIIDSSLNPVRDYIRKTLDENNSEKVNYPQDENFTIREYKSAYCSDPEINFIIPWVAEKLVYLQVKFSRYEVRLPFRFVSSVLDMLFDEQKQRIASALSQFPDGEDKFLSIPIYCTKLNPHECFFDILFGKSLPPK